jgi:metal-responsive CopG/Arc/MetJ family transcriptional regulator
MTRAIHITIPNDIFDEVEILRLNSKKMGNKITRSEVVQALIRKGLKETKNETTKEV